jgi:MFS family permease
MNPAPARPAASTAIIVLVLAFAANMVGRGVGDAFLVLVLPLSNEFGWGRAQVSSVFSIYLLVNGLSAPLTGVILDRWGPRVVYPLGLVLLGSACRVASHLTGIWQFQLTLGVLAGMGSSMLGMVPLTQARSRTQEAAPARMKKGGRASGGASFFLKGSTVALQPVLDSGCISSRRRRRVLTSA